MKWGILATGTIAKKFAGTIAAMRGEGEVLWAVGSRSKETAEAFAAAQGVERAYGFYEALAEDPAVEIIYVATPNSMHYEHVKLCLEHGKHVLCEKPFVFHPGEARELYALAREKGLFLMEGLWTWFLPLYGRLRKLLASGAIGEVREIRSEYGFVAEGARRVRKFTSSLGGGALLDIGIYNLGFLRAVTGEDPREVVTDAVRYGEFGTDEYSRISLEYPGGAKASCVQTIGTVLERRGQILGSRGRIDLPDFQMATEMTLEAGRGQERMAFPFEINGFEYEIREASRCVGEGRCASAVYTPEDSIALTELLYRIRADWGMRFEGETPVETP